MKIISHLLTSVIAILIASYLISGTEVTLIGAFVLAIVLGVLNLFVKPIVRLIALPVTVLTLGLFSLVINAFFIILADKFVADFYVSGFWAAFWFAIVLSIVNAFFGAFKKEE